MIAALKNYINSIIDYFSLRRRLERIAKRASRNNEKLYFCITISEIKNAAKEGKTQIRILLTEKEVDKLTSMGFKLKKDRGEFYFISWDL